MSHSKKYLLLLLILYCAVRLPIILSLQESFHEDVYRGVIAVEFLEGWHLPIWDYAADPYGLGAILAGVWTIPFFLLFGKSLFALKLAPFFWHFLSLIAWYFVWRPHFTPKQTFFILGFFVLSPPQITEYTLYNSGYHFEMILWMALSIILFRRILENAGDMAGPAFSNIFLLGFLGGFSGSMIPTNLITVIVIWIYMALYRGNIQKRFFYLFYIVGFLVGFTPWILFQIYLNGQGFQHVVYFFAVDNPLFHLLKNILKVFFKERNGFQILFGFFELPSLIGNAFMLVTMGFYFFSFLLLLKRKWKIQTKHFDIEAFGLLFQILLIVAVAADRFGMGLAYYLFPLVPFIGMTLVTAFNSRWAQKGMAVVFLTTGIIGNASFIHFNDFGKSMKLDGYSYFLWGRVLGSKFCDDFTLLEGKFKKVLNGRPPETQKLLYEGVHDSCQK